MRIKGGSNEWACSEITQSRFKPKGHKNGRFGIAVKRDSLENNANLVGHMTISLEVKSI